MNIIAVVLVSRRKWTHYVGKKCDLWKSSLAVWMIRSGPQRIKKFSYTKR